MEQFTKLYHPITSRPFLSDVTYTEYQPCSLLEPYIACYWKSEERNGCESGKKEVLVIPDTCIDILIYVNYAKQKVTGKLCLLQDRPFLAHQGNVSDKITTFAIRFHFWSAGIFLNMDFRDTRNQNVEFRIPNRKWEQFLERFLYLQTTEQWIAWTEEFLIENMQQIDTNSNLLNAIWKILSARGRTPIKEIRTWIYRNARPLDLAMWKVLFENGTGSEVAEVLACYQNADGGFGNGVEADCWNTESSPYATMIAAGALRMSGYIEKAGVDNPLVQGIFRYLDSGVQQNEEGWYFCIPSNDQFPRAPWWSYSEESNHLHGMGITAGLCSFILHYGDPKTRLFETAMEYSGKILKRAAVEEEFGEMGAGGIFMLIGEICQKGLEANFELDGLTKRLIGVMNSTIERDVEKWQFYTPRPSAFIESPMNPLYKENEAIINQELDYTIDTRNPGGVWNITWSWFDLGETYPKEFAISENWWMANKAIEKLVFLKSFGRLEE